MLLFQENSEGRTEYALNNIEELKGLKELLDQGAITEEEYDVKKQQLLALDGNASAGQGDVQETKIQKKRKPMKKETRKKIIIAICAAVIVIVGAFIVKSIISASHTKARNEALIEAIEPIMSSYDIADYSVGDIRDDGYNFFEVYAEGFEDLSKKDAMKMLIDLDKVGDIDDPLGGKDISLSSVNIYPGKDADYYYYRVTSAWVKAGKSNYTKPGIYTSNGMKCVYPCDN